MPHKNSEKKNLYFKDKKMRKIFTYYKRFNNTISSFFNILISRRKFRTRNSFIRQHFHENRDENTIFPLKLPSFIILHLFTVPHSNISIQSFSYLPTQNSFTMPYKSILCPLCKSVVIYITGPLLLDPYTTQFSFRKSYMCISMCRH